MSAKVAFLSKEVAKADNAPRIAVPASAIVDRDGKKVVYTVKDGKVSEVAVTTGTSAGDLVQVTGVAAGARVVLKPPERMRDGTAVTTTSK
jgi:hypothetical protein